MARRRATGPLFTWQGRTLLVVLGLAAAAGGVYYLGTLTRAQILDWQRYRIPFATISCLPPPGLTRDEFLSEVQYLAGTGETLALLDDDLPARLATAFGKHPWVERVERVEVTPPRRVHVQLTYRTPALAVLLPDAVPEQLPLVHLAARSPTGARTIVPGRVVDARGVLLPPNAPAEGLPTLLAHVALPAGPAGTAWGDPTVAAAARLADFLRPFRDRLNLDHFEYAEGQFYLSRPGYRVTWGQAPGDEPPGEATAGQKVERLLEQRAQLRGADAPGLDVRRGKP